MNRDYGHDAHRLGKHVLGCPGEESLQKPRTLIESPRDLCQRASMYQRGRSVPRFGNETERTTFVEVQYVMTEIFRSLSKAYAESLEI